MRENINNYSMRLFGFFFVLFCFVLFLVLVCFVKEEGIQRDRMVQKFLVKKGYLNWGLKLRILMESREERAFQREEKTYTKLGCKDVTWSFRNSKGTRGVKAKGHKVGFEGGLPGRDAWGFFLWVTRKLGKFYRQCRAARFKREDRPARMPCKDQVQKNRQSLGRTGSTIAYLTITGWEMGKESGV